MLPRLARISYDNLSCQHLLIGLMQTTQTEPETETLHTKEDDGAFVKVTAKEAYDYLRGFIDGSKGESRPINALDVLYRWCRKYADLLIDGEVQH